jgi:hypothetical protein
MTPTSIEIPVSTTITLDIIKIDTVTESDYKQFADTFDKSKQNLCINPTTNEIDQNLWDFLKKNYKSAKKFNNDDEIIVLYQNELIIAFALVHIEGNIITLELLCGNADKKIKYDGKSLGSYLLDFLCNYYINNSSGIILKIEPAVPELIPYYIRWKKPALPLSKFPIEKTFGYLIYGDIENITEDDGTEILKDLNFVRYLKDKLSIKETEIPRSNIKKFFLNKINNSIVGNYKKKEWSDYVNTISVFSLNDVLHKIKHLTPGSVSRHSPVYSNHSLYSPVPRYSPHRQHSAYPSLPHHSPVYSLSGGKKRKSKNKKRHRYRKSRRHK